ncbi:MAG: exodeoxyribonuclease VII small subunit [Alphaproteobacteria bacterium]|nr:exodeoxyribonuclease VII small subunit [Alphaproteobacteria bacterium]
MAEKTFEEMLNELENIVRNLESGRVGLEDALKAYQEGMKLKTACEAKLAAAKEQIDKLIIEKDQIVGKEPFDVEGA